MKGLELALASLAKGIKMASRPATGMTESDWDDWIENAVQTEIVLAKIREITGMDDERITQGSDPGQA